MSKKNKGKKASKDEGGAIINRKAGFKFILLEKMEAGMVLTGSEVKSLRAGRANLGDAYAMVLGQEVWLLNAHISHYDPAAHNNHAPTRRRKLLLKSIEITRLIGKTKEKGLTLIPTRLYFNKRGIAKCEIALAKGKDLHDKRETLKKRDTDIEMRRAMKR